MGVSLKRRLVNRVVFSAPGLHVFPRVAPFLKRAYNIIVNNDLTPAINGEYWLIGEFPDDGVYFDVGYHRGDWSKTVISKKSDARVVGFDPWPEARSYHASSSVADRVEFFPIALADHEGNDTFYSYDNACNSLTPRDLEGVPPVEKYLVPVTTLDTFCRDAGVRYVDLLKIDAEGYDLNVLNGARGLLRTHAIGAFVFEYSDAWIHSRNLLGEAAEYICDTGYHLCKLFDGFVAPFDYAIGHETFAGAMFVGISPEVWDEDRLPLRNIRV
jgi:FkbM family methyltransferase